MTSDAALASASRWQGSIPRRNRCVTSPDAVTSSMRSHPLPTPSASAGTGAANRAEGPIRLMTSGRAVTPGAAEDSAVSARLSGPPTRRTAPLRRLTMRRFSTRTLLATASAALAAMLLVVGGLLLWGSAYVHNTVQGQL